MLARFINDKINLDNSPGAAANSIELLSCKLAVHISFHSGDAVIAIVP